MATCNEGKSGSSKKNVPGKAQPVKAHSEWSGGNRKEGFLSAMLAAGHPTLPPPPSHLPDAKVIPKRNRISKDWLLRHGKLTEEIKTPALSGGAQDGGERTLSFQSQNPLWFEALTFAIQKTPPHLPIRWGVMLAHQSVPGWILWARAPSVTLCACWGSAGQEGWGPEESRICFTPRCPPPPYPEALGLSRLEGIQIVQRGHHHD